MAYSSSAASSPTPQSCTRQAHAQPAPRGLLAVTIDTEEEGLWSGTYAAQGTVENIAAVPRFQSLCDRFAIRPTYLVTTPVAASDAAVGVLQAIHEAGRCEIGAHVHPWNSPPLTESHSSGAQSYLCNLSPDEQRHKISGLTDLIERRFQRRPRAFRAGRYGMGMEGIRILSELGYRVDSSVIPYTSYASASGPDFREADCRPYYPSGPSILDRGQPPGLLEVPVTAGFTHRYFELADRMRSIALTPPWRSLRMVGVLDRLGFASKVKLSPEQASFAQMRSLAAAVDRRGVRSLVLMFHSSSLRPGNSPYVRDEQQLDAFLLRLEQFFQFCLEELNYTALPLGEFPQHATLLTR